MWTWLRRLFGGAPSSARTRWPGHEGPDAAAELVAGQVGGWSADELVLLLGHSQAPVRDLARAGLQRQGLAALPALLRGLDHHDSEVGKGSAELLGEFGHPDAVRPLLKAMKFNARPVQIAARRALVRLGSLSLPALVEARGETNPWLRQQIEGAIAEIQAGQPAPSP